MRERHHSFYRVMTGLLAICLSACLVLMVGVSYARYQQDFAPVDYSWTAEEETGLILGGVVTQSWLDAGSWPENPNWQSGETDARVEFSVSNGRSHSTYAPQDQTYTLQMLAGLNINDPESITVQLSYEKDGQTVQLRGAAEEIPAGSILHSQFGDGWIYRFFDENEKEQSFALPGGALHYQSFTLTISGTTDPTLLQLRLDVPYQD